MNELWVQILPSVKLIIQAVLGFIGLQIGMFIKAKTTEAQRKWATNVIKASVEYVEQAAHVSSEEKFNIAFHRAKDGLNDIGFDMSDDELEMWIESFVFGLQGGE